MPRLPDPTYLRAPAPIVLPSLLMCDFGHLADEIARLETALQNFVSAEESQRQAEDLDRNKTSHAALLEEWESVAESLQETD